MFGAPTGQKSMVQMGETGVDEFGVTQLEFKNGVIAECRYGLKLDLDGDARIYGEEGYIVVHPSGRVPAANDTTMKMS